MSEAMNAAAPAASEGNSTVIEQVVQTPNPISTELVQADKVDAKADPKADATKPIVSARDAIKAAREKIEAKEVADAAKPVKADAKVEAKVDPKAAIAKTDDAKTSTRDETGRFKGKVDDTIDAEGKPVQAAAQGERPKYEAPKRFSPDAVAEWDKTPDTVKAEIHRAQSELEKGIEKYRPSAERYERVKEFDDIAQSNGYDLRQSLEKVVALEQAFARNPMEGFQKVAEHFGYNMREVAAHIMGQTPDQVQSQQNGTIAELRRELADLKQQVGGVTSTIQEQKLSATSAQVEKFASDNPRFHDIQDDIAFFLNSGKVEKNLPPMQRLQEAYDLAARLNPAPAASHQAPVVEQKTDLTAQTRKGEKSISGAPSAGSNPATTKQPSTSIKDSLKRAFAQAS